MMPRAHSHPPPRDQRPVCVCTAEATYWRASLRWKVVLQVMYYTDGRRVRGKGPFFPIGYAWSEAKARAMAEDANNRLARSQGAIIDAMRHAEEQDAPWT